jgi:hypothetical protein
MPLPTPKGKEQKKDFVSRCITTVSNDKTFKDQKQVIAVCYSQWEHAKASADAIVGSGDQETLFSAQRFGGKKRGDLKDSDFLYPEERSFPIVTPQDVSDAAHSFGRSKGKNFDEFKKKLVRKARSKGPEFVAKLPDTIKEEFNIKASETAESVREEYVEQTREVLKEAIGYAQNLLILCEDESFHSRLSQPWVFEKLVIAKTAICGSHNYVVFGEDEDENKENSPSVVNTADISNTTGETGENANPAREARIRNAFDNKWGADTY